MLCNFAFLGLYINFLAVCYNFLSSSVYVYRNVYVSLVRLNFRVIEKILIYINTKVFFYFPLLNSYCVIINII